MKKFALFILLGISLISYSQTIPVTFYVDANNHQYETAQMWHFPDYYDYTNDNSDNEFELTLDLEAGTTWYYHVIVDNGWGWDFLSPFYANDRPNDGAYLAISDPMISYLLPKDGDMLRENRIQADFAFSTDNPPLASSISVVINGNTVSNASDYYDDTKQRLYIDSPEYLIEGTNEVTVSYETNNGQISRTSTFRHESIKLMNETIVYRMDSILAWGRVFGTTLPSSVFVGCNNKKYEAPVNSEGYFGIPALLNSGNNLVKVAYSEEGLSNPVDTLTLKAEIRHNWWVELNGSVSGSTATINTLFHDIASENLAIEWFEEEENPKTIGISGLGSSISFNIPDSVGNYIVGAKFTDNAGEIYTAKTMLIVGESGSHFLGINERAPWMKHMSVYEVENSFFDNYTFQQLKRILPHIKKAGIEAFRIAPFVMGGFISYDHFDIYEPTGSMEDLQDLVESAHAYGLKIFFDVPVSHIGPYHPFLYPSFLLKENAEPFLNFVLWEGTPGESDIQYSPDNGKQCVYTNLNNPYVESYFFRLMEYWVEVAGCDGFRIDCGQESFIRSPEFATEMLKRLRNINPNLFILNEGDNRNKPEINYYDYGDAAYDWKLNSEWGDGGEGFPGVYKGMYTVDELHELLTTGTPDSGLVMRYANSGYHDYFHDRYGWEQERTAFAVASTSYGLVNVFQGEMVGAERANGSFDLSDPMNNMPFYTRLIKMRKNYLGNYPKIERIDISNSDMVYCYTSSRDTAMVLTVANFADAEVTVTISLSDAAFNSTQIYGMYEVVDSVYWDLNGNTTVDITLGNYETKVFVINAQEETLFPSASSIKITNISGKNEISEDKGSLNFIADILPLNSTDEVEWKITGDTDLALINDGILTTCGCGAGTVTVIAYAVSNPEIADSVMVNISNQESGLITNADFYSNVNNWGLWTPECENTLDWDNGKAHLNYNNASECWSQFMSTANFSVEEGKTYKVSFDVYATANYTVFCNIRKSSDGYEDLSNESGFNITTDNNTYGFEFEALATSSIAQIHFNIGAATADFWFDNISVCPVYETSTDSVNVTFQVDMQNESVSSDVYLCGSFNSWSGVEALTPNGTVYSTTLKLAKNTTYEYKFLIGEEWETVNSECAVGGSGNREIVTEESDSVLSPVCFKTCDACLSIVDSVNVTFKVDMQNQEVSSAGVNLAGNFDNWNAAVELSEDEDFFYTTLKLPVGSSIKYKFINGGFTDWSMYEIISGDCAYGNDANRQITVPPSDTILPRVCFGSCESCNVSSIETPSNTEIHVFPNPTDNIIVVANLPADKIIKIEIYDINSSVLKEIVTNQQTSIQIDLGTVNAGIYFMNIIGDDFNKTIRIINKGGN